MKRGRSAAGERDGTKAPVTRPPMTANGQRRAAATTPPAIPPVPPLSAEEKQLLEDVEAKVTERQKELDLLWKRSMKCCENMYGQQRTFLVEITNEREANRRKIQRCEEVLSQVREELKEHRVVVVKQSERTKHAEADAQEALSLLAKSRREAAELENQIDARVSDSVCIQTQTAESEGQIKKSKTNIALLAERRVNQMKDIQSLEKNREVAREVMNEAQAQLVLKGKGKEELRAKIDAIRARKGVS